MLLIWRCAESSCLVDFIIGGEARGHVSNTLVYTQMKSFRGFNIGSPYQNRQSAKLKIRKIYVLYGILLGTVMLLSRNSQWYLLGTYRHAFILFKDLAKLAYLSSFV